MQQLPFDAFLPLSTWIAPRVCDLPSWKGVPRACIDIESKDKDLKELGIGVRRDGEIIGASFAFEDGQGFYLPWGHVGEGNLDKEQCLQYLRDQAAVFEGVLTGANLQYDLDYLAEHGVIFYRAEIRDIQVAEPLINEHRLRYGLDPLCEVYHIPGKDEKLLREAAAVYKVNPKSGLYLLAPKFVGLYAEQDAHAPLRILRKQERSIEDEGLWNIYLLECKLTPILIKMRRRGVLVDQDRLAMLTTHVGKTKADMCKAINRHTPINLAPTDLKKAAAIGPILEFLGLKVPRTAKTKQFSIDKKYLDSIDHPVAKMIKDARGMDTMHSFCKGLPRYITRAGRIHATTNQLKTDREDGGGSKGTVSGRCSMNSPNLQQQPIRHKTLGAVWRGIYRPEPGCKWTSCDYSAQEPRLTIHYAELTKCKGAKAAGDRFRNNPTEDAYAHMMKVTGMDRKTCKVIVLGSSYGMGPGKLCDSLGYPTETKKIDGVWRRVAGAQGQAVINKFHEEVPFIRELARKCEKKAKNVGKITTLLGRGIHFEKDDLGNFEFTYKALNRLIQGGSADQMKQAMIIADQLGIKIQLQVHDELDFSSKSPAHAEELAQAMRDAVPLLVPSVVDTESGDSWGEINEEGRVQCQEFYGVAA